MPVDDRKNKCDLVLVAICLFFSLALAFWWLLDNTYPQWDAANHTKAAVHYADLIKHAHVFSAAWYRAFLSVDYQYPLVVNLINGFLKVIFVSADLQNGCSKEFLLLCVIRFLSSRF